VGWQAFVASLVQPLPADQTGDDADHVALEN
jgi:hypothetical protein